MIPVLKELLLFLERQNKPKALLSTYAEIQTLNARGAQAERSEGEAELLVGTSERKKASRGPEARRGEGATEGTDAPRPKGQSVCQQKEAWAGGDGRSCWGPVRPTRREEGRQKTEALEGQGNRSLTR